MQDFLNRFIENGMLGAFIMFNAGYLACLWINWKRLQAGKQAEKAEQAARAAQADGKQVQA